MSTFQEWWDFLDEYDWDFFNEDNWDSLKDTDTSVDSIRTFYIDVSNFVSFIIYSFNQNNILSLQISSNLPNLLSAGTEIVNSGQDINVEQVLSPAITAANNIYITYSNPLLDSTLSGFVRSLQNYIIKTYGDLNEFLLEKSIKVSPLFAGYSTSIGFSINQENIKNA